MSDQPPKPRLEDQKHENEDIGVETIRRGGIEYAERRAKRAQKRARVAQERDDASPTSLVSQTFDPYIDPSTLLPWTTFALNEWPKNDNDKTVIAQRLADLFNATFVAPNPTNAASIKQQYMRNLPPMTANTISYVYPFRPSFIYSALVRRGFDRGITPLDVRWAVRFPYRDLEQRVSEKLKSLRIELRNAQTGLEELREGHRQKGHLDEMKQAAYESYEIQILDLKTRIATMRLEEAIEEMESKSFKPFKTTEFRLEIEGCKERLERLKEGKDDSLTEEEFERIKIPVVEPNESEDEGFGGSEDEDDEEDQEEDDGESEEDDDGEY